MATCNVQTLLRNAACFGCLSPGEWDILELQLLCEILNASSGGATIQVISSADLNPNTAAILPANQALGAIWYQTPSLGSGSNVWTWDTATQTWSQFSA
jgi:hypothetical protein